MLSALVDVLEVTNDERYSAKDRIKALVVLSNFAVLDSLRSDILRSFRNASATFETLLTSKLQANKSYGNKKITTEHQLVVVLLFRCVDYKLGADDLLDLLSNDVDIALALVETLLKSSYELPLVIGLVRLLGEFVHPSTYFHATPTSTETDEGKHNAGAGKEEEKIEREISCTEFTSRVDRLVQHLMGGTLLSTVAAAVSKHIHRFSRLKDRVTDDDIVSLAALVRHAMVFLLNNYTFLSHQPATFRQHLVVGVNIPSLIIIPFLSKVVLCSFGNQPNTSTDPNQISSAMSSLVRTTSCCLQLLSIMYFRLNGNPSANEHILQHMNVTAQIMTALPSSPSNHPKLMGLMVLFHANVDSLGPIMRSFAEKETWPKDSSPDALYQVFQVVLRSFKENDVQRGRLIRMLENPEPLPIARDTETLQKLCALVEQLDEGEEEEEEEEGEEEEGEEEEEEEIIEEEETTREGKEGDGGVVKTTTMRRVKKSKQRPGFGSSKSTFRLLGDLPSFEAHKEERSTEAQELHKKNKKKKKRKRKTKPRNSNCPPEFRCNIDGCLMKMPMRTKGGLYFEKDTIEKWIGRCGQICPVTGDPLALKDLVYDEVMSNNIQKYNVNKALGRGGGGGGGGSATPQQAANYESKTGGGFDNDDDLYVF